MTRTTEAQILADQATRTIFESPVGAQYRDLLRQAQGEVGRDMGKAIKTGMQWVGDQGAKVWQALADVTQPPTAAA